MAQIERFYAIPNIVRGGGIEKVVAVKNGGGGDRASCDVAGGYKVKLRIMAKNLYINVTESSGNCAER